MSSDAGATITFSVEVLSADEGQHRTSGTLALHAERVPSAVVYLAGTLSAGDYVLSFPDGFTWEAELRPEDDSSQGQTLIVKAPVPAHLLPPG